MIEIILISGSKIEKNTNKIKNIILSFAQTPHHKLLVSLASKQLFQIREWVFKSFKSEVLVRNFSS